MFNLTNKELLKSLEETAKKLLGEEHACTQALSHARSEATPEMLEKAQAQINALAPKELDQLLGQTHACMATDPKAILKQWQPPKRAN